MIALPEELLPDIVGSGWVDREPRETPSARAHLHDGRCVECIPRGHVMLAVDAESVHCPAAHELAEWNGVTVEELLAHWTRAEVAAKLLRRPSLLAFREDAARDPALTIRTGAFDDLVVSVGWLPRGEQRPMPSLRNR